MKKIEIKGFFYFFLALGNFVWALGNFYFFGLN